MVDKNELHDDDVVREDAEDYEHDEDLELEEEDEQIREKLKKLRSKLALLESEKRAAFEEKARVQADFLNSKRRLEEQFKSDRERVVDRVVSDFLPLIDSFENALAHTGSPGGDWEKGVRAMHTQFIAILKGYGISEIECVGSTFNPHEHEAVTSRKGEEGERPDTVIQVLQQGYKRGYTIIRPATVVIAE